jgi:hypothetical protein
MSTLEKAASDKLALSEPAGETIIGRARWHEAIVATRRSATSRLKRVADGVRSRVSKPRRVIAHAIVVDAGNNTLVAVGTHIPTMVFLRASLLDTWYDVGITAPEILRIKESDPRTYPEWSWDIRTRTLTTTNPAVITEQMRERAVLAAKKGDMIFRATYLINRARDKVNTGLFFQETIYAAKERQARMLKDAGFDEGLSASTPYVVQYAEETGMSLQDAAEDILFQAQLFHEHLEKTEKVRLALFGKIKRARTVQEVDEVMDRFHREGVA